MTQIERVVFRFRGGSVVVGALAAVVLLNAPASSQQPTDSKWLPFIGCWETDVPANAPLRPGAVCMTARDGGVEAITVADGRVTSSRTLIADGQRRDVEESGCAGWERASWSSDGQRVYLRSEMACEGGIQRVTSGVLAMATPTEWMEVQAIESGGYPAVRALRYRPAGEEVAAVAGVQVPTQLSLAVETARTAAAEPLSVADINEAAGELTTEALEMLLFERSGTIEVNAAGLVSMADAGVPDRVIDLVVALAHPQTFAVNSDARMVGYRPAEVQTREWGDERRSRRVYDSFYYDPFGYRSYGYGSYYSPFGWGGPYGWRSTGTPIIIIQPPAEGSEPAGNPRLVKGRGYTRGSSTARDSERGSAPPRADAGRSSSGSSSAVGSRSSGSSSGSASSGSTGRTAKRRGGG